MPSDTSQATALGWFHLVTALVLLPASLLFGALMQGYGAATAFAAAAAFALVAAALLTVMPLDRRHAGEPTWPGS